MDDEMLQKAFNDRGCTFEKRLGRGAFGCVYQVSEHSGSPGQKYAIKLLDTKKRDMDDPQKYIRREVKLLVTLGIQEQNVVQYYEHWDMTVGGTPYLCIKMELCWRDLFSFVYDNDMGGAEIVKAQGEPRLYQKVFPQILEGIAAIHSKNWVHRDIHFRNILVATPKPSTISEIKIKIADFGLARKIESMEALTPYSALFSAPELSSEKYDKKVDLYSAGIVLYFLSRYIEDETRWVSEIEELKHQAPFYDHLCFQDKVLITLIMSLTNKNPNDRLTAVEALTMMQTPADTSLRDTENSPSTGTSFLVKKKGDKYWKRGTCENFTLSSLKDGVHSCTGVEPKLQTLVHYIGEERQLPVKIDDDDQVERMFLSPNEFRPGMKKRICLEVE